MIILISIISTFITEIYASNFKAYESFNMILESYVDSSGMINYKGIRENPYSFSEYFDFIENISPRSHPSSFKSKADEMAYWINAYNALTVKIMMENPEANSILDMSSFLIFKKRFVVGGENMSLNRIEHKILRKGFKDPRIHFAINCASLSCPPLGNRIFLGDTLEQQLDEKTRNFIANTINVRIDHNEKIIYLNKIFKWFAKDFNNVRLFISQYLSDKESYSIIKDYKIKYFDYDWNLNESK